MRKKESMISFLSCIVPRLVCCLLHKSCFIGFCWREKRRVRRSLREMYLIIYVYIIPSTHSTQNNGTG